MLRALSCALIALGCTRAVAQASPPMLRFHFENPQTQPSAYTITLEEDGSGHFHSEPGTTPPQNAADLPSEGQDRPIHVSAATAQRIFAVARAKKLFTVNCDNSGKVAFTGKKELSYSGPDGQGSCEYNYSHDQQLQWLTSEMQGIAATLEEGRRLELEHQHDRLTLDPELGTLIEMVHNGQAVELGTIASTLLAIEQDGAVLERAQRRAHQLLQEVDAADAQPPKP